MIEETGDRKKASTTDYVSRPYLGSLGKIDHSLVTVLLVALVGQITVPLAWRIFKPKSRLRPERRCGRRGGSQSGGTSLTGLLRDGLPRKWCEAKSAPSAMCC